jgi:integrase
VRRTWVGNKIQDVPKSKAGMRTIDMSLELCDMLASIMRDRISPWLFMRDDGRPWTTRAVDKRFKKIVKSAKLPQHLTPHSMRHTFAKRHLEAGARVEWLSRQMGHRRIGITIDIYGKWARMSDKEAADRLDNGWAKRQGKLEGM